MKDQQAIVAIIEELKRLYPEAACSLPFDKTKAYELLFSVRLAAQCTDARVNQVTPVLYARFPTLESLAQAKSMHDTLEGLYNPHVDFQRVYDTADALIQELLEGDSSQG